MNISYVEDILIKAVHSDKTANEFMLSNLSNEELFYIILDIVETSDSGDARMEGAYYLSKYSKELLMKEEERLLVLIDDEWNSVAVHIMIALSRIKSSRALEKIIEQRIQPALYWEAQALKNYFQQEI